VDHFIGNIDAKVDAKGRVFVPAAFRKILQSTEDTRLVLRKDIYENCLVLYPGNVWEDELAFLRSKLRKYARESRQIYRKFIQDSELLELDSNGRILIPKRYLQIAGIVGDVRFMGVDHRIEIWNPDQLDNPVMDEETFEEKMDQLLGSLE
jgi:MraZ protein